MVSADQANVTQQMLNDMVLFATGKLLYLATGTGDAPITLSSTDVEGAVPITSEGRNLLATSVTQDDNFFRILFRLTSTMPLTLPVDYQQIGIFEGVDDTTGMLWGRTLAVAITKDNNSQHDIIISGRVIELETVIIV